MVRGIDIFRDHFRSFSDRYILIGGSACEIVMGEAALDFRATKDLDIVLCVEILDATFVEAFWQFISSGGYKTYERSPGKRQCHRFHKPKKSDFPFMLELFSRVPDLLQTSEGSHLTPLPMEEDISGLSAIVLDSDYYDFLSSGRRELEGLPYLAAEYLIPLKAVAWLELTKCKEKGEEIPSRDIKKHKNDVYRLFQVIDPDAIPLLPDSIEKDLHDFLLRMKEDDIDVKTLGIRRVTREEIIARLRAFYRLDQAT